VLGCGAALTGKVYGVERVPVVKGQAISAYDPRTIKGTGVTYATSPQGADHTAGLTIRAKINHLDPNGQIEISRNAQVNAAGYDSLGVCSFAGFGFAALRDGTVKSNSIDTQRAFSLYYGLTTGHAHKDMLNLGIYAFGLDLSPDLAYPEATGLDPNRYQWVMNTISHNTVVVDAKGQNEDYIQYIGAPHILTMQEI
jgi:hypothetical protein